MKKILFFLLIPVYAPIMFFLHFTHDKDGGGWYDKLWYSDSLIKKTLFVGLSFIYAPLIYFMFFTFDMWTDLLEE